MPPNPTPSPNFAFLAHHDARLVALATQAEEHFAGDPNVALYKLRQFCEVLAKRAAAKVGLLLDPREDLHRVIDALFERSAIGATQRTLFHQLRRAGNEAVHDLVGSQTEALHQLKVAHQLAIWFQRSFGHSRKFDPGPFIPPTEPKRADAALHDELQRLRRDVDARRKELEVAQRAIDNARQAAEAELAAHLTQKELAAKAREDAAIWEALANEQIQAHQATAQAEAQKSAALEEQNRKLLADLAALQATAEAMPPRELALTIEHASQASDAIHLDEAATRRLIDKQLRDAGWERVASWPPTCACRASPVGMRFPRGGTALRVGQVLGAVHKSGSVRGAPGRPGVPARPSTARPGPLRARRDHQPTPRAPSRSAPAPTLAPAPALAFALALALRSRSRHPRHAPGGEQCAHAPTPRPKMTRYQN